MSNLENSITSHNTLSTYRVNKRRYSDTKAESPLNYNIIQSVLHPALKTAPTFDSRPTKRKRHPKKAALSSRTRKRESHVSTKDETMALIPLIDRLPYAGVLQNVESEPKQRAGAEPKKGNPKRRKSGGVFVTPGKPASQIREAYDTEFVPGELDEGCRIGFADPGMVRQVVSKRGGWFKEKGVVMGVRYVIW